MYELALAKKERRYLLTTLERARHLDESTIEMRNEKLKSCPLASSIIIVLKCDSICLPIKLAIKPGIDG